MDRRQFIKNSAGGLGSLTSVEGAARAATEEQEGPRTGNAPTKIGRPVRAVSIGFKPGPSLEQIAGMVDKE